MQDVIAVDTETVRDNAPYSVQWSGRPGQASVTLAAGEGPALRALRDKLESPSTLTVVHNALFDVPVLHQLNIHPHTVADTMVMAYLLGENSIGLKVLAHRYCGMDMREYTDVVKGPADRKALQYLTAVAAADWPDPDGVVEIRPDGSQHVRWPQNIKTKTLKLLKKFSADPTIDLRDKWRGMDGREAVSTAMGEMEPGWLDEVPVPEFIQYACADADATIRLYPLLWARIQEQHLEDVFWLDMGVVPIVTDMMETGMLIDKAHFHTLQEEFDEKAEAVLERIEDIGGHYINPGSPKQVLAALTARGLHLNSTDASELDAHRGDDLVRAIQDYRAYRKLNSTYIAVLPGLADRSGRVHTRLSITRTATGRLASSEPNLQNQPVRSEDGRRIRQGFIAERSDSG